MVNAKTWNPAQIDQAIRRLEGIIRSGSYNPAVLNQLLNQLGEPGYINTWNPAELNQKLRTLLHDLLSWKTATGNPIQLRTNNGGLVQSCKVNFSPIQSGSGDPSPTNIRPISGRDSLYLYVDTEQTETPEKTYTATFPDTVYEGYYDFMSGVVSVDKVCVDLGTLRWSYSDNVGHERFNSTDISTLAKLPETASDVGNIICSRYKAVSNGDNFSHVGGFSIALGQVGNGNIFVYDSNYTDANAFKTAMSGVQLCYELATPIEITLTPEEIELLTGANVLWTDGDSIEITYKKLLLPSDVEELSKNKKIKEKPKTRSKKKKEE